MYPYQCIYIYRHILYINLYCIYTYIFENLFPLLNNQAHHTVTQGHHVLNVLMMIGIHMTPVNGFIYCS